MGCERIAVGNRWYLGCLGNGGNGCLGGFLLVGKSTFSNCVTLSISCDFNLNFLYSLIE